MVAIETREPSPAAARAGHGPCGEEIRLCVYRASGDTGEFDSGLVLPGPRPASIGQALEAAGPAVPGTKEAGRFAVLHPTSGSEMYVELDGCQRHEPVRQGRRGRRPTRRRA